MSDDRDTTAVPDLGALEQPARFERRVCQWCDYVQYVLEDADLDLCPRCRQPAAMRCEAIPEPDEVYLYRTKIVAPLIAHARALRAEVARLQTEVHRYGLRVGAEVDRCVLVERQRDRLRAEVAALTAERDRYRAALEQIHWRADASDPVSVVAGGIARAALAGQEAG